MSAEESLCCPWLGVGTKSQKKKQLLNNFYFLPCFILSGGNERSQQSARMWKGKGEKQGEQPLKGFLESLLISAFFCRLVSFTYTPTHQTGLHEKELRIKVTVCMIMSPQAFEAL